MTSFRSILVLGIAMTLAPACLQSGGSAADDTVEAPEPDTSEAPDTSEPDIAGPDAGEPDAAEPDAQPDVATELPCFVIQPEMLDFGATVAGTTKTTQLTIEACGTTPVTLVGVGIGEPGEASPFALDLGGLPGVSPGTSSLSAADEPVVLAPGSAATITVSYGPTDLSPVDGDGVPIFEVETLRFTFAGSPLERLVAVRGVSVDVEGTLPAPIIEVLEGDEVIPQTKVHLDGTGSFMVAGEITAYQWSVQQPEGSQSVFLPSPSHPNPTFEVNVAGTYIFRLEVWGTGGAQSMEAAEFQVFVTPDEAVHVELLWHTPNDSDETDEGPEAGADLDLHFAHAYATGSTDGDGDGAKDGWFDAPFDTFWFNPNPNWGSFDPMIDDDPGLDRDDTDGAGPENLNLNIPEDGTTYRIGVHYWADHGYGVSFATVRIYVFGTLVFEEANVALENHDMWEVATLQWPSGDVTAIAADDGGPKIMPLYEDPLFFGE